MTPDDEYARRGADNVVTECLSVTAGETVAICWWDADDERAMLDGAVTRAGAKGRSIDLAPIVARAAQGATREELANVIAPQLDGCAAVITVNAKGAQPTALFGVLDAARRINARHVALGMIDTKLLAQGMRASPDLLATINERLSVAFKAPCTIRVTSDAGTDLEVALDPRYPIVPWSGRPGRGESQSLPTGGVSVHPSSVDGVFVADRIVRFFPGEQIAAAALRRAPVTARFEKGAVKGIECADASTVETVKQYLASHPNAARVGTVFVPANYLVRIETGNVRQDLLLPGLNLHLGLSSQRLTRAPFDAPVQANLTARKLKVECRGTTVVADGRLTDSFVAGIDPFR